MTWKQYNRFQKESRLKGFARMLRRWEKTAKALGAARRKHLPAERRLDLALAEQERRLVIQIYKETFGHKIGYPKLPRPRITSR